MDNNQNQASMGQNITPNQAQAPQQGVPTQFAQTITQQPQVQMPQNAVPPKKSHIVRTLLIMIILAVVVILSILVYLSFANNQIDNTSTIQIENNTSIPTSAPITPTTEEEINAVDAGDVEVDLKEVDTDLQTL